MKKKIKLIIKITMILMFVSLLISTSIENLSIRYEIKQFISQGVYQEDISTKSIKFYAVYDEDIKQESFTIEDEQIRPGSTGDIIIGLASPLENTIFDPFITFFIGGHSALCSDMYHDKNLHISNKDCIEATGTINYENSTAISCDRIYWMDEFYRKEVIGLRVKCSDSEKEKALNYAISYINDPYNDLFIFNTNTKKYCTDLISQAYKKVGVNLNKDGGAVTVLDLAFSSETSITYYHKYDDVRTLHIYYKTNKI